MIYQSSAQNYKWKAISIFHKKSKPIAAHAVQRAREREAAHRRGVAHTQRRPAMRKPARASTLAKMPLDYEQNNPQSMLLFL